MTKPSEKSSWKRARSIMTARRSMVMGGLGLAILAVGAWGVTAGLPTVPAESKRQVTLYKDPQCTCCEGYADYLRHSGFEVSVVNTHDLALINEENGVPAQLQGCHLAKVEGYLVGGHVPVGIVNRLLAEKPAIKGITLPGMPQGSPGMVGTKAAPFKVYEIGNGEPRLYATE